jgi:multicomponent K+:H+ antiporter subunit F
MNAGWLSAWVASWFNASEHLGAVSQYAITFAIFAFGVALVLNVYRLVRGPSTADRILALDMAYINAMALTLLIGTANASSTFFEAALIIAMLGFVGTVALSKFLQRGDIVE